MAHKIAEEKKKKWILGRKKEGGGILFGFGPFFLWLQSVPRKSGPIFKEIEIKFIGIDTCDIFWPKFYFVYLPYIGLSVLYEKWRLS